MSGITVPKPEPVVTDSRHIPAAIKRYVFFRDGGRCISCGAKSELEYDHCPEWNLLQPKRHDPDKIFLLCAPCHAKKSPRNTTEAARAKRLNRTHTEGKKPSKTPLKSAGFAKDRPKQKIQSAGFKKRDKIPVKRM